MNRFLVLMLAALTYPAILDAQNADARVRAAESRVVAAGVPVSLLQTRVAEGRAKGIPMERIAAVVERRAASLVEAKAAMAPAAARLTAADLGAGADALEAGIDGGSLRTLIAQARAEDRPVAIAVLTYLHHDRGLPVDQALRQVTDALKKGSAALRELPAQAAAQARGNRGQGAGMGNAGARGRGHVQGPPQGMPATGAKPGGGKPAGVGRGSGNGRGKGGG